MPQDPLPEDGTERDQIDHERYGCGGALRRKFHMKLVALKVPKRQFTRAMH